MKYERKCKQWPIIINKDFVKSAELLSDIERNYKNKNFSNALKIISKNINLINIPSFSELSIFFDIVASILWKMGKNNKAYLFWKKSYEIDKNNRHSKLSLDFLFNNEERKKYFYELFIRLKMNEFLSNKGNCSKEKKKKIIKFLTNYWDKNLSNKNWEEFDDIEIADYFIGLKIFYK